MSDMMMPEIKRVTNFEGFKGKTVKEVVEKGFYLRFVFTDGTFADLEAEASTSAKITIEKGKQRRRNPYH